MSERTSIEWTEATWNPWMGCTKVSTGCDNCYMFTEQSRYGQDPATVRRSKTKFDAPLKWPGSKLIFACSWSDWFHVDADPWRDEAWDIIRRTPQHTYQILTKRPGRILRHLPSDWGDGYPNVWLGASVEDDRVLHRAWLLGDVPARIRFISAEPLLGPIDFRHPWRTLRSIAGQAGESLSALSKMHWVIVGGESGPDCRPMEMEWVRDIHEQCVETNTAFFLKQLGGFPDKRGHEAALLDGKRYTEMPLMPPDLTTVLERSLALNQ